jgi:hypothetical protein
LFIDFFVYVPRHWTDVKGRTPASVLTVLLKKNHPGMIEYGGRVVVASTWKHYQAATDSAGKSAADVVSEGFWVILYFHIDHLIIISSVVQLIGPSFVGSAVQYMCIYIIFIFFIAAVYLNLIILAEKIQIQSS